MKKKICYLFMCVPFLVASIFLLARPIGDMDEIWNYNFGYNICNGLYPYSEFNCIVTPFSAALSASFMKVFGDNLFAFRVLGAALIAVTFYLLFLILNDCVQDKTLAFVGASFMFALCFIVWIFNYNNLNLLFILLAIFLEMKIEVNKHQNCAVTHLAVGFVYGMIFVSKQSVGMLMLIYNSAWSVFFWLKNRKKGNAFALRLISGFIPLIVLVVYLLASNTFDDFWNYAVQGISTFTHRITYFDFIFSSGINFVIGVFPLIVTIFSLNVLRKGKSRVSRRFHVSSLIISCMGLSVAYPLCDYIHMCIAVVPFTVCAFCCIKPVQLSKCEARICVVVAAVILSFVSIAEIKTVGDFKVCDLNNYQGLVIEKGLEENIKEIDQYILSKEKDGYEVLIADSYATAYLLPIERYYKDFSLLNIGNLGTQSVSELLWRENAIYLVRSDQSLANQQSCYELIEYITTNYIKIGEVLGFDVYETV